MQSRPRRHHVGRWKRIKFIRVLDERIEVSEEESFVRMKGEPPSIIQQNIEGVLTSTAALEIERFMLLQTRTDPIPRRSLFHESTKKGPDR